MNYKKLHDIIIDRSRNRIYDSSIHNNHHIIPLHEDPTSTEVTPLTYKEHMVIHHLRWKITGTIGNKLAYLRFKGMEEEFHRESAKAGGKKGGKKTKESKSGIFSENYDRSKETVSRWENGIITKEKLKLTTEIARERGLKSAASGKGIYSDSYDRSKANKSVWDNMNPVERERRINILRSQSKYAGQIAKEKKSGFHGLSEEIKKENSSKGGKSNIGKRWMNKNGKSTRIPKELINNYLENGWEFGLVINGGNNE